MKAVLIGADLMYRQDGKLVPIEINTNTAWDAENRVEANLDDIFDLDSFRDFLNAHDIEEVWVDGLMSRKLCEYYGDRGINIVAKTDQEFAEAEDRDGLLLLRTSYSDEALVDAFCRDKARFLKAIENRDFGCEYILKTAEGFEGNITTVLDNGEYPNFIVKYRYPVYDRAVYPKLVKLSTSDDLVDFLESDEMPEDYLIMPFYYNANKLWNGRIKVLRHFSMFVAEGSELESVYLGTYTKVCGNLEGVECQYSDLGVLDSDSREAFLTNWTQRAGGDVLAEAGDLILMADGTWKPVEEIQVGDEIKSLDVPTQGGVDIKHHVEDYNISFEELEDGSSFSTAAIKSIFPNRKIATKVNLKFTDGTDWWDTENSSYPTIDPEDGTVWFRTLDMLNVGDKVILLVQAEDFEEPIFVEKEIAEIEESREVVEGYQLSVDGSHLFLSKTVGETEAYVSIEHNTTVVEYCNFGANCYNPTKLDGSSCGGVSLYQTTIRAINVSEAYLAYLNIYSWNGAHAYSYSQASNLLPVTAKYNASLTGECLSYSLRYNISSVYSLNVGNPSTVTYQWSGYSPGSNTISYHDNLDISVGPRNYLTEIVFNF